MVKQVDNPSYDALNRRLSKFVAWLKASGAEVLVPTNEWEMLRFDSARGVGVVYFNKRRETRFTGEAKRAWTAYKTAEAWNEEGRGQRGPKLTPKVKALLARDGDACFLCRDPMGDDITVEHLVAVCHEGPRHISNLFLAHKACNEKLGHLSAVGKIKMRETFRRDPVECACGADQYERLAG